ncbi:hypothetical protein [Actinomycetospora flava]|uniref:Uncharacterized protein n=1 Tax=Actinomycetospora flava TaxID=3129232 RepID=A0ABU8M737_9PSEU
MLEDPPGQLHPLVIGEPRSGGSNDRGRGHAVPGSVEGSHNATPGLAVRTDREQLVRLDARHHTRQVGRELRSLPEGNPAKGINGRRQCLRGHGGGHEGRDRREGRHGDLITTLVTFREPPGGRHSLVEAIVPHEQYGVAGGGLANLGHERVV